MKAQRSLTVVSSSFGDGAPIPESFSANGADRSPALEWSGAPVEAKSAFLFVEDPDAPRATPFVHWMVANLPPDGSLKEAETPSGIPGKNDAGTTAYFGPKPPPGGPHHYHFRVFALDRVLDLKPGFTRDDALSAIRSHAVAQGECVGTYQAR